MGIGVAFSLDRLEIDRRLRNSHQAPATGDKVLNPFGDEQFVCSGLPAHGGGERDAGAGSLPSRPADLQAP